MKIKKFTASVLSALLTAASTLPPSAAAAAAPSMNSIGVAGAVKGLVKAIAASDRKKVGRIIESGKPLYLNEHVTTGPGGHLQIMLKDETIFTIGPDSDIVLDEFVYNPETDAGKVSASVTKGVFRFITGNIGKKDPSAMDVKLPAGTIGIRGTIVAGQVGLDGTSLVVLLGPGPAAAGARVGAFDLSNAQGSVFVDKPGFGSTLRGESVPPTPPAFVPPAQMKEILSNLAPKTNAARAEEGKQMMAERLAQKLAGKDGKEDGKKESGQGEKEFMERGGRGSRQMSKEEQKIAEKMMTGEPLSKEEQAMAREEMKNSNMSPAEMKIAEKMMSGTSLTPEEQHQVSVMMAGEHMMEHMGGSGQMTPEQMRMAEKMMTGSLTPEQQQSMMRNMTPEQRAMMGDMMPPPPGMEGGYGGQPYGDPNAMMGGHPMMPGNMTPEQQQAMMQNMTPEQQAMMGEMMPPPPGAYPAYDPSDPNAYTDATAYISPTSPYGGVDNYNSTDQYFDTIINQTNPYYIPPPDGIPDGPATWDQIRNNVVSGTGYFPARSGSFYLTTCNGGSCANTTGSWGFSNVLVDFGAKTISGTGYISGASADGIATPIKDDRAFNANFSTLTGGAVIVAGGPVLQGGGNAQYIYGIGNAGGIPAHGLKGDVSYYNGNGGTGTPTSGVGQSLVSFRVDGTPPP